MQYTLYIAPNGGTKPPQQKKESKGAVMLTINPINPYGIPPPRYVKVQEIWGAVGHGEDWLVWLATLTAQQRQGPQLVVLATQAAQVRQTYPTRAAWLQHLCANNKEKLQHLHEELSRLSPVLQHIRTGIQVAMANGAPTTNPQ